MDPFARVATALRSANVRFVVIGVWGANYYARGSLFVTQDQDLFVPLDAQNLLRAWQACESIGLDLVSNDEPLDQPRDLVLAESVVRWKALTTATDGGVLCVDLTMIMGNFDFDEVAARQRVFQSDGVEVPVASLTDIIAAKAAANRPKDRLFLTSHAEELRRLMGPG